MSQGIAGFALRGRDVLDLADGRQASLPFERKEKRVRAPSAFPNVPYFVRARP